MRVIRRGPSEDILVEGVSSLRGGCLKSYGDHRTAMSMVIAGLLAEGSTVIDDISCIKKSFPEFLAILKPLIR
jgi:3-phosphoshikimate 1-carboxyvinyltransferase